MRRAVLIFNPRAGQRRARRALPEIRRILAGSFELSLQPTEGPDHCRAIARQALAERLDVFFVLGGDGTLRVAASVLAGSDVALGALPGGTTNVVAGALGLPEDPVAAARALLTAEPTEMDLGRTQGSGGEPFLMQLSAGLDAQVMAHIDPRSKKRFGKGAVAMTGLREWFRYRFPPFALEIDGGASGASGVLEATGFVVANLPQYAGKLEIVPGARADDRQLELLLFHGHRRRDALGFALALVRGRHLERRDVSVRRFANLRVTAPAEILLQADGDPFVAPAPLTVALATERLKILAPRA